MTSHIVRETEKLKRRLMTLSADVEETYLLAVRSLEERDEALAKKVAASDDRIDRQEVDLEEECLKILALHQPVANDLRFIVSVLKINNDLERIADMSVNIAERALDLMKYKPMAIPFEFSCMSQKVYSMVKKSLDSLVNLDLHEAHEVIALDDEVDSLHHKSYGLVIEQIRQQPDCIEPLISYLVVSRYLERIADLAINIAEDVHYLIKGDIVRHIM
ncbi:MAG: phosphate signaling complex protein PhoU [Desulfuromonadaceae bacterium]|nr:phosphate signaling complex protein PhoU [Desulfuromonadaceae bacterium]